MTPHKKPRLSLTPAGEQEERFRRQLKILDRPVDELRYHETIRACNDLLSESDWLLDKPWSFFTIKWSGECQVYPLEYTARHGILELMVQWAMRADDWVPACDYCDSIISDESATPSSREHAAANKLVCLLERHEDKEASEFLKEIDSSEEFEWLRESEVSNGHLLAVKARAYMEAAGDFAAAFKAAFAALNLPRVKLDIHDRFWSKLIVLAYKPVGALEVEKHVKSWRYFLKHLSAADPEVIARRHYIEWLARANKQTPFEAAETELNWLLESGEPIDNILGGNEGGNPKMILATKVILVGLAVTTVCLSVMP